MNGNVSRSFWLRLKLSIVYMSVMAVGWHPTGRRQANFGQEYESKCHKAVLEANHTIQVFLTFRCCERLREWRGVSLRKWIPKKKNPYPSIPYQFDEFLATQYFWKYVFSKDSLYICINEFWHILKHFLFPPIYWNKIFVMRRQMASYHQPKISC